MSTKATGRQTLLYQSGLAGRGDVDPLVVRDEVAR